MKVLHSRHLISAGKFVDPVILPLRTIRNPRSARRIRLQDSVRCHFCAGEIQRQHLPIQRNLHSVIHRLLRGQRQSNRENFFLPGRILESVIARKPHSIRAEPQQPFLPVINVQVGHDLAGVQWHHVRYIVRFRLLDLFPVFFRLNRLRHLRNVAGHRRVLLLCRSPGGSDPARQLRSRILRP